MTALQTSAPRALASPADFQLCRAWIAHHSKSFYLSSLLLPRAVRREAWALYAFCRRADDAVDDAEAGEQGMARVRSLERRLLRVYGGDLSGDAIDRAYAQVAARAGIPQALPRRLLRGMEMDAEGTRYETVADLLG